MSDPRCSYERRPSLTPRLYRSPAGLVRTGQPHRTLLGHTAPVTCLQFDELHIVTGSLDKSIRVRAALLLARRF